MPRTEGLPLYFIAYMIALQHDVPMQPPIKSEQKMRALWDRWNAITHRSGAQL